MPQSVHNANDLVFTAVFESHPANVADPTVNDWVFRVGRLLAGRETNDALRPELRLAPGKLARSISSCAALQGIALGRTYLISTDNIGSLTSVETVAWEVLPAERVRLVRQYGSTGLDAAFLRPQTVSEVLALVAPRGGLPPTDSIRAADQLGGTAVPQGSLVLAAVLGALAWHRRRRSVGSLMHDGEIP